MTPLTEDELARLETLANAATPGPRTVRQMDSGPHGMTFFGTSHWNVRAANPDDPETGPQWTTSGVRSEADARYVAALDPGTVLALIAALRATPVADVDDPEAWRMRTVKPSQSPTPPEGLETLSERAWREALARPSFRAALDEGLADLEAGRTEQWATVRQRLQAASPAPDPGAGAVGDMPDQLVVQGHLFVHVAACPCPRIQAEVARLAPSAVSGGSADDD